MHPKTKIKTNMQGPSKPSFASIPIWISAIAILFISIFWGIPHYVTTYKPLDLEFTELSGQTGDTIGGTIGPIIGFIGAILTFMAFFIQYRANQIQLKSLDDQKRSSEKQEKQIAVQQFEGNFFELLKLHRENVAEMHYRGQDARNVIVKIVDELYEIFESLNKAEFFDRRIYQNRDFANIGYLILYYGVSDSVIDAIENRLVQTYGYEKSSAILEWVGASLKTKSSKFERHYYNGHQSRLGHYFRHMFRLVNYVHGNSLISSEEKKEYMKLFRAQLSTHEQIIMFFNSISDLGQAWELDKNIAEENKMISRYHLIKNIPLGSLYGFKIKSYFPNLDLENEFELKDHP